MLPCSGAEWIVGGFAGGEEVNSEQESVVPDSYVPTTKVAEEEGEVEPASSRQTKKRRILESDSDEDL